MVGAFLREQEMPAAVDYADVQGLVRFGHAAMTEGCYFLVKISDPRAARNWLANAPVTTAEEKAPLPSSALQVAFTSEGLKKLNVPDVVIGGFSTEFITGMTGDPSRSRRLGDTYQNSPENWYWGAPGDVPHAVVMLFARPGQLERVKQSIQNQYWNAAFSDVKCLSTTNMGGREAFGFIDGISQPEPDWGLTRVVSRNCDQLEYGNVVCLGEFLLGYSNEYGRYTDRPLLDPGDHGSEELVEAQDHPGKRDLGLNGTYLVMRDLEQDVRGFWKFAEEVAGSSPALRYQFAEAMVGRVLSDGRPLVPLSEDRVAGVGTSTSPDKRKLDIELNQFTYDSDPGGVRCPLGAHVRRGNPRNADIPGKPQWWLPHLIHILGFGDKNIRDDLISSTRFHRLLRRGREFGEQLSPEEALQQGPANEPPRGLRFVAVNANIQRQFEFIQNAWLARTKFDGLTEESDPLLGNRAPVQGCPFTDAFSLGQENGLRQRIMDVRQFITVRGGAYFFLPSMRALRYISKIGQ
jgi:deferrochelatase/peroxidase EfeB